MQNDAALRVQFNEILALIGKGRADQAEDICRRSIAENPRNANMVALLGAILVRQKQYDESETWLRKAIEIAPAFAKPHEDLGFVLLQQHRPEEAVEMLRNATRLDPSLELAHFNLGKALAAIGKGKEADEAYEKSFELNPIRKKLAYAAEHQASGEFDTAESLAREVLRLEPQNVDALRLLGTIAANQSQFDEAERRFRQVLEITPDFVRVIVDLGRILKERNRYEKAIACFKEAIALAPHDVQPRYLLASTLAPAALNYEAVEAYEQVLKLQPEHAGALLGYGHMLKTVGKQDEAVEAYRKFIRLNPDHGEGYWSLANLKTVRLDDSDIKTIEASLENEEITDQSRVNFLFTLAKTHEDTGDFDQAWEHYREGNQQRRTLESYDPVSMEVRNDAIVSVFSTDFLAKNSHLGNPDPSPIFVVGLPRSGSTLIEQILASHSMIEGTAELPYLSQVAGSLSKNRADGINYPEAVLELGESQFKALGQDYLDLAKMHRVEGKPRFIDKMPNNTPGIGLAHLILPNAKIIDARRYPLDSCLSCYRQLFAKGQSFTYDLTDIGEYFLQYLRMMDHWHEVLPGRALTIQYEEIVTDFENQVGRLLEYCELPWEDSCIEFHQTERPVRTASSEQVRQPIYTDSIHRWRNYEKHLDELIEILEPVLPRFAQFEQINQ